MMESSISIYKKNDIFENAVQILQVSFGTT